MELARVVILDTILTPPFVWLAQPSTLIACSVLMSILALPAQSASQALLAQSALLDTLGIALCAIQDTAVLAVLLVPQDTTPLPPPALLVLPLIVTASPAAMLPPASPAQLDTQQPVCA